MLFWWLTFFCLFWMVLIKLFIIVSPFLQLLGATFFSVFQPFLRSHALHTRDFLNQVLMVRHSVLIVSQGNKFVVWSYTEKNVREKHKSPGGMSSIHPNSGYSLLYMQDVQRMLPSIAFWSEKSKIGSSIIHKTSHFHTVFSAALRTLFCLEQTESTSITGQLHQ